MKFDPFAWSEVKSDQKTQAESGVLRVRSARPAALYVEAEGVETLVGYGTSWEVVLSCPVSFWVEGGAGFARVFYYSPRSSVHEHDGEVFTNIDRMSDESGNLLAVRQALRQLEISKRDAMREIRELSVRMPPRKVVEEPVLIEPLEAEK